MKAWMRVLKVTLTSQLFPKAMVFGQNGLEGKNDLEISVVIHKYMAALNDSCTIRISNLTYSEIVQIVDGKFFNVEVQCGYKNSPVVTVFKGGVVGLTNDISEQKKTTLVMLCTSELIARFSQQRINFSLNSQINTYSLLNYVTKRAGIASSNISTQFKKDIEERIQADTQTVGGWFESMVQQNPDWVVNADSSNNAILSIFNASRSDYRKIKITADQMLLRNYPTINNDGIEFSMFPSFGFMCGDTIELEKGIINIPLNAYGDAESMVSAVSKNFGYYLDEEGLYIIYEMTYQLENRGPSFALNMRCRSRTAFSKLVEGTS